ncbi:ABC transporter ATP-binding protein [Lacimicrobium sp. SS2-24]|uniref:ABC transporter ATP-binding protein n=1 Tax=Lacimicrobium sp. SS2-24 TaxID=2005569 RepID=UPI000B4B6E04|nr:ABC transporter ATP-binding protein [Lacimicrobium sp. SS2-24]
MLDVSNLAVYYGEHQVVSDVSFSLEKDEILMLVGPTGCGKTTILNVLAGLVPIHAGTISLANWRATAKQLIPPEKRQLGMVFQDFALFPHLSVEQNIYFKLKRRDRAEHWIRLLGLDAHRHAWPATLSGGQKQRVALARTLAHDPQCVLLDEPLSNLDAALKDSLRWEIRDALKKAGVPAIWVTHDQEEALSVGDRIGVLKGGRLHQLDTPERCFSEPSDRFVARFLGEASFLPGRLSADKKIAMTTLGEAPAIPINEACDNIDLLLRPDDLSVHQDEKGEGYIKWVRYEGGARFYAVQLEDKDIELRVRVNHEQQLAPGQRVSMRITTTHPLAAFNRL